MRPGTARRLVRLYPRRLRRRYGDEITALLSTPAAGWRDLLDVVAVAVREHGEVVMAHRLRIIAVVLAVAALAFLVRAVTQLRDGVPEIPQHWWSTAPVLVLLGAIALWVYAGWRRPPAGR